MPERGAGESPHGPSRRLPAPAPLPPPTGGQAGAVSSGCHASCYDAGQSSDSRYSTVASAVAAQRSTRKEKKAAAVTWAPSPRQVPIVTSKTKASLYQSIEEAHEADQEVEAGCDRCCEGSTMALEDYFFACVRPITNTVHSAAARTSSRSLIIYYVIGVIAYRYLEDWDPVQSIYFMTVTGTTVGFGELVPLTHLGKLFTCFYAVIGISVVLAALTPLVAILHGDWRDKLLISVGSQSGVDLKDVSLDIEEVNKRINYTRRYVVAFISPAAMLISGVALHYFTIREPPADSEGVLLWPSLGVAIDYYGIIDGLYWAVISLLTIGFGDIVPKSPMAQILVTVYLPLGVIAIADALADIQMIAVRRGIRETDFSKLADECLLRDACRVVGKPNLHPILTEAEFLIDQLLTNNLVDKEAVLAIRRQFKSLTNQVIDEEQGTPVLTTEDVYKSLRTRIEVGKEVSPGAEAMDIGTFSNFKWTNFAEWERYSWQMRVLARDEDLRAKAAGEGTEDVPRDI